MASASAAAEQRLVVRRLIPAPPAAVFRAWTTPTSVKQWFSSPEAPARKVTIEPRAGGRLLIECVFRGGGWTLDSVIREFDPPRRLSFTWVSSDIPADCGSIVTVDFNEKNGGTEVVITQTGFPGGAKRAENESGWSELLANLDSQMQSQRALRAEVRRTFRASAEDVWRAWTTPEGLRRIMSDGSGPDRMDADVRVGGRFVIDMAYQGGTYHHEGEYLEVDRPRRLRFSWISDASPADLKSTVTVDIIAKGDQTEVVLLHEGHLDEPSRADHEAGWTEIVEKLGLRPEA